MRTLQPYIHTISPAPYLTGPHVHATEATYIHPPLPPRVQPFSGPLTQKGMKRQTGVLALLQACVARYINEDTPPRNSRMGPQQQESRAEMKRLAAVWPPQGSEWVHHSASIKAVAQTKNNNKRERKVHQMGSISPPQWKTQPGSRNCTKTAAEKGPARKAG